MRRFLVTLAGWLEAERVPSWWAARPCSQFGWVGVSLSSLAWFGRCVSLRSLCASAARVAASSRRSVPPRYSRSAAFRGSSPSPAGFPRPPVGRLVCPVGGRESGRAVGAGFFVRALARGWRVCVVIHTFIHKSIPKDCTFSSLRLVVGTPPAHREVHSWLTASWPASTMPVPTLTRPPL